MSRLLTRRWMIAHILLTGAVATCLLAGRWQLRRLDQRRDHNRLLLARQTQTVVGASDLSTSDDLAFRRAALTGTYDGDAQLLITGRVLSGRTGSEVLTPLRTGGGIGVLVVRGWVPQQIDDPAFPLPPPPQGPVRVWGLLVPSSEPGRFGPRPDPSGTLRSLPILDVGRVAAQLPYEVADVVLRLEAQDPAPAPGQPLPSPLQPLGEGPHLAYAIQWFLFAAVFLGGYAVLIRKASRSDRLATR